MKMVTIDGVVFQVGLPAKKAAGYVLNNLTKEDKFIACVHDNMLGTYALMSGIGAGKTALYSEPAARLIIQNRPLDIMWYLQLTPISDKFLDLPDGFESRFAAIRYQNRYLPERLCGECFTPDVAYHEFSVVDRSGIDVPNTSEVGFTWVKHNDVFLSKNPVFCGDCARLMEMSGILEGGKDSGN